jgi:hypothetical protein
VGSGTCRARKELALWSEIRRAAWSQLIEGLRVSGLALICAERSLHTRRLQFWSAPRVLLSSQGQQRELEQRRTVAQNYAEKLRAGSSPAPVSRTNASSFECVARRVHSRPPFFGRSRLLSPCCRARDCCPAESDGGLEVRREVSSSSAFTRNVLKLLTPGKTFVISRSRVQVPPPAPTSSRGVQQLRCRNFRGILPNGFLR